MSTLTKIFIVVMVVLAIAACVLFTQQSFTASNYKAAWEHQMKKALAFEADAIAARRANKGLGDEYRRLLASAVKDVAALQSSLDQDKQELAGALATIASLETTKVALQASNAGLTKSVEQQVLRNDELSELLADRLKVVQNQNDLLQKYELELKTLARDFQLAKRAAAVKEEQLAKSQAMVKELEDKIRRSGLGRLEAQPGAPTPISRIDATVLAVDMEHNIAMLNVGMASGVTKGMQFILYRGDEPVAMLDVTEVQANMSAGPLSDVQLQPQQGDKATTDLGL